MFGVGCSVGWSGSLEFQVWDWVHGCEGVAILDDWGREVVGAICFYGLECLESEKQGQVESSWQCASPGCETIKNNVGIVPSKYASDWSASE